MTNMPSGPQDILYVPILGTCNVSIMSWDPCAGKLESSVFNS